MRMLAEPQEVVGALPESLNASLFLRNVLETMGSHDVVQSVQQIRGVWLFTLWFGELTVETQGEEK